LLVGVALYSAKTFGEGFGIAVFAAGADFGAAADRIPGCVGPFDGGFDCHSRLDPLKRKAKSVLLHFEVRDYLTRGDSFAVEFAGDNDSSDSFSGLCHQIAHV